MRFKTIYLDPPWLETGGGKIKRGADKHYPLMKTKDIMNLPIDKLTEENCHLYIWYPNNHLEDALSCVNHWGFVYKTQITWTKLRLDNDKIILQQGLGQYFKGTTESCLFAIKGNLPYKIKDNKRQQGVTAILASRTKHSEKPEEMRKMIEKVSYPPYIEVFARIPHENWISLGNELDGLDIIQAINNVIEK